MRRRRFQAKPFAIDSTSGRGPDSQGKSTAIVRHWQRVAFSVGITCLVMLVALLARPARSAIEIGPDEHFEVTKAALWARGYPLYQVVWNDQQPLFTALTGTLFKYLRPTSGVARTLAACYGVLLLLGFCLLVKERCGALAAYVAVICLLVSPHVLELCLSVMLEVPAMATLLWALWLVYRWADKGRWPMLALSGIVFAAALQTKLTASLAAPALAAEIVHLSGHFGTRKLYTVAARNLAIWGISLLGGFLALALVLGSGYREMWASHFSVATERATAAIGFSPQLWLDHPEAFSGAGVGLYLVALRREWRRLMFPVVFLATVALVHFEHCPWWYYYYLHFALPFAWLTGYAVAESIRYVTASVKEKRSRPTFLVLGNAVAASSLVALLAACGGSRLLGEVEHICALPRVGENALIAKMRQYAPGTRWVYTRQTIYPFHAGLLVIPELAVLPAKRFWSGQITQEQIWTTVKRYRPEQLLLPDGPLDSGIKEFVEAGYTRVYEDGANVLYVAKSVAGP